ncbi:hypothetical protein K2173_022119 [Erythroxylum novogranatense]|uniref:Protein SMG7 n=1 Tax=Erythroxylum novogranatense TaxID=1862640 RepID=A0AAV8TV85_9ROSI|nr:hypothetical protein K2173_022119 [Erythroxylum novogranatense]
MMIVKMDRMSAPSWECAQRLYEKNIEIENKRRCSAQARVPSDPNAWQQMRENYEAIILEDHGFSEQHNVEYALWQLHYRHIEEFRAHFSAALSSSGSNLSPGVKVSTRPDRVTKIRLQFKTFLSEATGFYHDLILKIRAKYGLPLGYFSEDSDNGIVMEKDGKKTTDIKKGFISCHRCLIYLGDLARYKGLYGEGDSKTREYAAASSYYLQAASLWPSSGNPHHQLAILASYSGDELVAVYRYFRSLSVDNPFATARDNLIVAFEKNRQNHSLLLKESYELLARKGKGKGKGDATFASRDVNFEAVAKKERASKVLEMHKSFCIQFIRLNGILFTRTSLETFAEVLRLASSGFCELLSSGPEEELNFGSDASENGMFIVRLISILIFSVHNGKREVEDQTYAEIVHRAFLLQNAFTALFEFMGHILYRCAELHNPTISFLLPGILIFVEWLACCPDVASGSYVDEKQASVWSHFWHQCISFLNKILSCHSMLLDGNEDETCFHNMHRYEEGETENLLALWEDFELRGFMPLLPAQTILDFSRKHPFGANGSKEKLARIKRILAAGMALANIVSVDQKSLCFDTRKNKFVIAADPQIAEDDVLTFDTKSMQEDMPIETAVSLGMIQPNQELYVEGEEEDEVIVFKPAGTRKQPDVLNTHWAVFEGLKPGLTVPQGDHQFYGGSAVVPLGNIRQPAVIGPIPHILATTSGSLPQHLQPIQQYTSKWPAEEAASLANNIKSVRFTENGHVTTNHEIQKELGIVPPVVRQVPFQQTVNLNNDNIFCDPLHTSEAVIPSKIDVIVSSGVLTDDMVVKTSAALPPATRKSPVSRPVRHHGPPPGFNPVPPKQVVEPVSGCDSMKNAPLMDDYSWLDGYQMPSSTKSSGFNSTSALVAHMTPQYLNNNNGLSEAISFPFPGKQAPTVQFQVEKQKDWQNYQGIEHFRVQQERLQHEQLVNGNQQFSPTPEQYHGRSIWSGRYVV